MLKILTIVTVAMFEGIFRKKKVERMDTPEQKAMEKDGRRAKVALGALGAALAADIALQPELPPLPQQKGRPEHVQKVTQEEFKKMQQPPEMGPEVTINYKPDIVNINPEIKPTSIDLTPKTVDSKQKFMKGDFSQGGIPAWSALTTEENSKPYTVQQGAESELQDLVNKAQKGPSQK